MATVERTPEDFTATDPQITLAREDHWAILAGLRFLLAFMVMVCHAQDFFGIPNFLWFNPLVLENNGAVIGFFIISGYSIAASLDRSSKGFYHRRFWRIYPVYLATFIYAQLPWLLIGTFFTIGFKESYFEAPNDKLSFLLNAVCLQMWWTDPVKTFVVSWSLACEVAYYAVAPLFRRLSTKILFAVGALSALLYLHHFAYHPEARQSQLQYGAAEACLLWAWLAGWLYYRYQNRPHMVWILFSCIFIVREGPTTVALTVLVIVFGQSWRLSEKLRKVFNYLGELSYPLYLSHLTTLILTLHYCRAYFGTLSLPYYVITIIIAAGFYHLIDIPSRKYAHYRKGGKNAPQPVSN